MQSENPAALVGLPLFGVPKRPPNITRLAFEFKASAAPQLAKGFFAVIEALQPERTWVVCPIDGEGYNLRDTVKVAGIGETLRDVRHQCFNQQDNVH